MSRVFRILWSRSHPFRKTEIFFVIHFGFSADEMSSRVGQPDKLMSYFGVCFQYTGDQIFRPNRFSSQAWSTNVGFADRLLFPKAEDPVAGGGEGGGERLSIYSTLRSTLVMMGVHHRSI